ncbi:NfeD family protein [Planosporangium flavigriseum]|uniref:NfeD family protein n=1 Tax=Planosporangium flavigriseum TaxID=373681 RepID=UPI00143B85DB|nr:NfeD family protein [Planosporangium flavigriseum]NJC65383.1 NfeD family protein [Planosporangium flavigriseum]
MAVLLWIVAAVGLAVAELFTGTFVLLMLAGGALAAAVTAALVDALWAQALVFALVSALALVVARPALKRRLDRGDGGAVRIGLAAIEGSAGVVLERVDADRGLVKIDGELWQARSFDGTEVYEPGERVQVIEVKGATAMVWRG